MGMAKWSKRVSPKVVREALDYQMQGGVSDVYNLTLIEMATLPGAQFMWGQHDSQYWQFPREVVTPELMARVTALVEREWTIEGRTKRFPADIGIVDAPGEHA